MNYLGYENYMIKSNRKYYNRNKRKIIFKLFVFFTIIFVTISFAIYNKTKIEKFFGLNRQLVQENTRVYMLKYSTYDNMEIAYNNSIQLKSLGGAGFVKSDKDKFSVYISTYPTIEKANQVKESLLKNNLTCEIEEIIFESFILKDSQIAGKYKECLQGHINTYMALYEIFENYSNNKIEAITNQKINNLYNDFKYKYENFIQDATLSNEFNVCSIYLGKLVNILENLVNFNQDLVWSIQYSMIKIVYEYQSMLNALSF